MARLCGPSGKSVPSAQQTGAREGWRSVGEQQQRGANLADKESRAALRRQQLQLQALRLKQGRGSDL